MHLSEPCLKVTNISSTSVEGSNVAVTYVFRTPGYAGYWHDDPVRICPHILTLDIADVSEHC